MRKIISGFQDGVDIAAIRAAHALGLQAGGWMPEGFLTESGPHPEYADLYDAQQMPYSANPYPPRTRKNVREADATLILCLHKSPGTSLTRTAARDAKKPFIFASLAPSWSGGFGVCSVEGSRLNFEVPEYEHGVAWIRRLLLNYDTINIAGNRDADEQAVQEWLRRLFVIVLDEQRNTPMTAPALERAGQKVLF